MPRPICSRFFALASVTALVAAVRAGVAVGEGIDLLAGVRVGAASGADVTPSVEAGTSGGLGVTVIDLVGTRVGSVASGAVAEESQAITNNKRIDSSGNPMNRFAVYIVLFLLNFFLKTEYHRPWVRIPEHVNPTRIDYLVFTRSSAVHQNWIPNATASLQPWG